jgi:hypothetical protein
LGHDATNPSKITVDRAAQELPLAMSAAIRHDVAETDP